MTAEYCGIEGCHCPDGLGGIEDAEDLRNLPRGSVIENRYGEIYEKGCPGFPALDALWYTTGSNLPRDTIAMGFDLPATVLRAGTTTHYHHEVPGIPVEDGPVF